MKLEGKLVKKLDIESGVSKAGKEWRKQSIVLNNGNDYNPEVCISFFGDEKIDMLSSLNTGDDLEVSVNVSSRAWNDKYFHSIDGWRVDIKGQGVPSNATLEAREDLPF